MKRKYLLGAFSVSKYIYLFVASTVINDFGRVSFSSIYPNLIFFMVKIISKSFKEIKDFPCSIFLVIFWGHYSMIKLNNKLLNII